MNEQRDYSLAAWTSWHVGGNAERFVCPATLTDLTDYLSALSHNSPEIPLTWLGLGSNVLIREGGIAGAVICTRDLQQFGQNLDGTLWAQAGVTCAKFARFACDHGFPEAVFFAGIPGTIGGALAMNAGAFGSETWAWVESVKVINRQGKVMHRVPGEYRLAYRTVARLEQTQQEEAFVEGVFRFPFQADREGRAEIRALLKKRAQSQPIGTLNCGSVYRNPPGDFAARLIEACGLKGYQQGAAQISLKHANFIINLGAATARDIEAIMQTIESQVRDKFGVALVPEVRILGK